MDYKAYKATYDTLVSEKGRQLMESDVIHRQQMEQKINEFLSKYPSVVPSDKRMDTPFLQLSLKEVFRRTIIVGIDVVNDISLIVSNYDTDGPIVTRRRLFEVFTHPERRLYIGVWLIFFAIVFFFIDGSS